MGQIICQFYRVSPVLVNGCLFTHQIDRANSNTGVCPLLRTYSTNNELFYLCFSFQKLFRETSASLNAESSTSLYSIL